MVSDADIDTTDFVILVLFGVLVPVGVLFEVVVVELDCLLSLSFDSKLVFLEFNDNPYLSIFFHSLAGDNYAALIMIFIVSIS